MNLEYVLEGADPKSEKTIDRLFEHIHSNATLAGEPISAIKTYNAITSKIINSKLLNDVESLVLVEGVHGKDKMFAQEITSDNNTYNSYITFEPYLYRYMGGLSITEYKFNEQLASLLRGINEYEEVLRLCCGNIRLKAHIHTDLTNAHFSAYHHLKHEDIDLANTELITSFRYANKAAKAFERIGQEENAARNLFTAGQAAKILAKNYIRHPKENEYWNRKGITTLSQFLKKEPYLPYKVQRAKEDIAYIHKYLQKTS